MAQPLSLASIKAGFQEGSVSVTSTQKAPGGFTVYRVVFKVCREMFILSNVTGLISCWSYAFRVFDVCV
jgi:hypothetical protein